MTSQLDFFAGEGNKRENAPGLTTTHICFANISSPAGAKRPRPKPIATRIICMTGSRKPGVIITPFA
jgi:hypothetical protein